MDRSKMVNAIIRTFNELQSKASSIFSQDNIIAKADLMLEEFFEAKFNPFLNEVKDAILSLPADDYTLIAIDSWIKKINGDLTKLEKGTNSEMYAEELYIKKKYQPMLLGTLKEVKLEVIERVFNVMNESISKDDALPFNEITNSPLPLGSIAQLISHLNNFNVIRGDIGIESTVNALAPIVGYEKNSLMNLLKYNRDNHRIEASSTFDELLVLRKVLKSILARVDNELQIRSSES